MPDLPRVDRRWLSAVGDATASYRRERSAAYRRKADAIVAKAIAEGEAETDGEDLAKWHRQRQRGQLRRIERVEQCQQEEQEIVCLKCGVVHVHAKRCRIASLCVSCRGAIIREKQSRFLASREVVLEDAKTRGLLLHNRRGGRWSEKLLTLTAPHVRGDSVIERTERILAAWREMLRYLNRRWRAQRAKSTQFYRSLEWTPGDDAAGHPHLHIWLFCPYLEQSDLVHLWGKALLSAGLSVEAVARGVILDIKEVTQGRGAAAELIKYLLKDLDAQGKKLPPELYAEVYKAFDERRQTQASKGFIGLSEKRPGCDCKEPEWYIRLGPAGSFKRKSP